MAGGSDQFPHYETKPEGQRRTEDAREDVAGAAEQVRRAAQETGARAREAGEEAVDAAADQARARKEQATNSLRRVADELDHAADACSDEDGWARGLLAQGAASLRNASGYLSGHRLEDLARDTETYARNNPAAYLGASIAAGFVLARLGKTATARARGATSSDIDGGRTGAGGYNL